MGVFAFLFACWVAMINAQCDIGQYACPNGDCISEDYVCDGDADCGVPYGADEDTSYCCDGVDAIYCYYDCYDVEDPSCYIASNGNQCVYSGYVCDGISDCYLDEDEVYCEDEGCYSDQHTCYDGRCFPISFQCDGVADCGYDNDDDENPIYCENCGDGDWQCAAGICIPPEWFCDGIVDCGQGDTSDEPAGCIPTDGCNDDYDWECASGTCIPLSWYCDGDTQDCGDGDTSDEPFGCEPVDDYGIGIDIGVSDLCMEGMGDYDFVENSGTESFEMVNEGCVPDSATNGNWDCNVGLSTFTQQCGAVSGRICTMTTALSGQCPMGDGDVVVSAQVSAKQYMCFPNVCNDNDMGAYNDFLNELIGGLFTEEYPSCSASFTLSCGGGGGTGGSFNPGFGGGDGGTGDGGGNGNAGGVDDACFEQMDESFYESNGTPQYEDANEDCITDDINDGPFECDNGLAPYEAKCHQQDGMMCTTRVEGEANAAGSDDCDNFGFTHYMCVPDVCTREDVADLEDAVDDLETDLEVELLSGYGLNCDIDIQFTCAAYSQGIGGLIIILSAFVVAVMN